MASPGYGQSSDASRAGQRARAVVEARKLVGIREHGFNRGPEVDALIKEAGGRLADAYCSWTFVVIMRRSGVMVPRFGRAAAWYDKAHTILRNGVPLPGFAPPQPGDGLGFSWGFSSIRHTETLIGPWGTGPSVRAVGGNTGGGGALKREGEGIFENWRLKRQITAAADVISNPKY